MTIVQKSMLLDTSNADYHLKMVGMNNAAKTMQLTRWLSFKSSSCRAQLSSSSACEKPPDFGERPRSSSQGFTLWQSTFKSRFSDWGSYILHCWRRGFRINSKVITNMVWIILRYVVHSDNLVVTVEEKWMSIWNVFSCTSANKIMPWV